jgi:methionyl-tRNA formyltransferase
MRIVFLGSPADAVPVLSALHDAGHDIALVVTQPDRRRARGGALLPSAVKHAAVALGLPVLTPAKTGEVRDEIAASAAALGVVVAFGQLIPPAVLEALPHGFVNLHFSLLPRWRGAAPVERAILAGDPETGVCLMALEAGLDTGPVYASTALPIRDDETAGELRARLVDAGTQLLLANLDAVPTTVPIPQTGEPTYASKLSVEEFALDWARPAADLARLVRAANPRPGAWTTVAGRRVKVLRARAVPVPVSGDEEGPDGAPGALLPGAVVATGHGALALDEVQPEGKGVIAARAWQAGLRGAPALGT